MTVATIFNSMNTLTQSFKKLLDKHATTLVQMLSLLLVGLLVYGFKTIAEAPVYAVWMYFTTAILAFVVIALILFRSARQG